LTPQAAFKLGHQVFGEAQVLQSALEGLGGVLRLAAIPCEALVRFQATTLASVGVLFGVSCAWRHGALLCSVRVFAG
jgi:hypothetical protein